MESFGIKYGTEQKIDSKDKKIMQVLFEDGRMSVATIAKKTGVRRDSVARRLKRLVKDQVITGFVPIVNAPALGYPNIALILVRTKTNDVANKKRFLNHLMANKFIVHVSTLIGKFDFYCSVIYKDTNHLNSLVDEIKSYVANFVEDFELYPVAEEPKFEDTKALL